MAKLTEYSRAEQIIIDKVGEFWWVCGKHRPEFIEAMNDFAKELLSKQGEPTGGEKENTCENCRDLYVNDSPDCNRCDEGFSNWHPIEQSQPVEQAKNKHETCDGCQMFQDCGCMLDDSCPECVEHHLWTPKVEQADKRAEQRKEKTSIMCMDCHKTIDKCDCEIYLDSVSAKIAHSDKRDELIEAQKELIELFKKYSGEIMFYGKDQIKRTKLRLKIEKLNKELKL